MTKPNPKASSRTPSGRGSAKKKQPAKSSSQQNSRGLSARASAPVSRSFTQRNQNQSSTNPPHTRTEVVSVIVSLATSTAFAVLQKYAINPGLPLTFPWLSAIAANYEQYKLKRFTIDYVPSCPTTTPGLVLIVPAPDAYEAAPVDVTSAYAFEGSAIGNAWDRLSCAIDSKKYNLTNSSARYVRTGQVPGDRKTYDFGVFWICCEGVPANTQLGTIRVSYTVELMEPVLASLQNQISIPNILILNDGAVSLNKIYAGSLSTPFDTSADGIYAGCVLFGFYTPTQADWWNVASFTTSFGSIFFPVLPKGFFRVTYQYLMIIPTDTAGSDFTEVVLYAGLTTNLTSYTPSSITPMLQYSLPINDALAGTDYFTIAGTMYLSVPQANTGLLFSLFHAGSSSIFGSLATFGGSSGAPYGCFCTIEFLSSDTASIPSGN